MDDNEEKRVLVLIAEQLERIGINATDGASRMRTRSNFEFVDNLNNHGMRSNLQFLDTMNQSLKFKALVATLSSLDADQLKRDLDFLRDFAEQKKANQSGFRTGLATSLGEWLVRALVAGIGMVATWIAFGRHGP
jgi:hypothetical protein